MAGNGCSRPVVSDSGKGSVDGLTSGAATRRRSLARNGLAARLSILAGAAAGASRCSTGPELSRVNAKEPIAAARAQAAMTPKGSLFKSCSVAFLPGSRPPWPAGGTSLVTNGNDPQGESLLLLMPECGVARYGKTW